MVVIINGTLGIGKTWIARWLVSQLENAAYIEGDVLGFVSQELLVNQSRQQFSLEIGLDLISSFRRKGAKIIVYDYLFVDPALMTDFISKIGAPVKTFYLSASQEAVASRIKQRGRPQAEKELTDSTKVENIQRSSFTIDNLGIEINTDNKNPEEIVELIINHLPK